jgi:protein-tyrosine phosphatase
MTAYWIEGPWPGRLAIVPRPRGGDWLDDEARAWKNGNVDLVVSLLDPDEEQALELTAEQAICQANGMEFFSIPIADRGLPRAGKEFSIALGAIAERVNLGQTAIVHCRQGIGRAPLLAASMLIVAGVDAGEAIRRVSEARGRPVPETGEQAEWLRGLAVAREMEDYAATGTFSSRMRLRAE